MANQVIEDIKFKFRHGNPVTRLILINAAVFLFLATLRIISFFSGESAVATSFEDLIGRNIFMPLSFHGLLHKPWTLFTYMFTQQGVQHLLWNMITLYWFGEILAQFTNYRKIIPLYILGGIAGGLVSLGLIAVIPAFKIYHFSYLLGASAGITAIIVAAAALIPNYKMNLLLIGPVRLLYVAMFVIFIDFLDVASYSNVGGNLAHLGGGLMGYIFIAQYKRGNDWAKPFNRFFDWWKGLFRKDASKMKVVHKKKLSDEEYNYLRKVDQQTVDAILDKISRSGYESLSKTEREILFKASKK